MRISDWSSDVCSSDLNLALALLAGVVIAGGAVFVREQLDDAIRAPEDIERKLGLPTLGAIPISGADDLREELALPRSPMAEAYNSLRTALLYSTPERMPPVVFVTSSGAGEGKSTTSYALRQGLARLDKRVVQIADGLRRPAEHRPLCLSN